MIQRDGNSREVQQRQRRLLTLSPLSLILFGMFLTVNPAHGENKAELEIQSLSQQKSHYRASYSETGMDVTQKVSEEIRFIEATNAASTNTGSIVTQSSGKWIRSVSSKAVVISTSATNTTTTTTTKPHVLDNNSLIPASITSKPSSLQQNASKVRVLSTGITENNSEQFKVYQYKQANGVIVFADHAPSGNDYQVKLYDCYACRADSELDWRQIPLFPHDYNELIGKAAKRYKLEPALIRAVIHAESAFNVSAISHAGAMGLMQLMPKTAKELGVSNAFSPEQNIEGGARYLAQILKRFDGDIDLACAAYNAGPATVTKYDGIPPYPETMAYVKRVKILLKRYRELG
ncbi:MAG: lytic transglycosylase domain-containing protein [Shewanella sp.]